MPDNKDNAGSPDNKRINRNEDYELQTAAKRNGVTKEEVEAAIDAVGTSTAAVDEYLQNQKKK